MCARYTLFAPAEAIADLLGVVLSDTDLAAFRTSRGYNVAPSQSAPIVWQTEASPEIGPALWGYHPHWAGEQAPSPINARAETVFDKPYFHRAIRQSRCLVPSTGWYEWQVVSRTEKRPFFIRPAGASVFAFAGLYTDSADAPGRRFAIVVGDAAPGLASLHPRQPVIIEPCDYAAWLDPATPQAALAALLGKRAGDYERQPVDRRVGNPRNDDPGLLEGRDR